MPQTPQAAPQSRPSIDFSDLGAKPIAAGPLDFSDLGAKPIDAQPQMGKPPVTESPGFFKRLGQSVGVPTSMEELRAASEAARPQSTSDWIGTALFPPYKAVKNTVTGYAGNVKRGFQEGYQETQDAARNISEGQPVLPNLAKGFYGGVHAGMQSVPIVGSPTETAGEDIQAKNYRGAAGGLTGVIGQVALASEPGQRAVAKTSALVKSAPGAIADTARSAYGIAKPEALSAEQSATKALKPRNSKVSWKQDVGSALPDVRRAVDSTGINIDKASLDDIENATAQAKKDVWGEYEQNFTGPNQSAAVDTTPVAKTIRSTISQRTLEQNPGLVDRVNAIAKTYEGRQLSVADLEDRIVELNGETRGIEARYPADKSAAKALPENAPIFAEREALKNLLISKLDEASGPGAQQLRSRYGALKSFQDVLQRRKAVYERANPESLGEQVGKFEGVGQMARGAVKVMTGQPSGLADIAGGYATRKVAQASRQINDSQFLLRQALRKTQPRPAMIPRVQGEYIQSPSPRQLPGIAGYLPSGQYEAPASPLPPQQALPMPVTEGEYLPPEQPRVRVRGILPHGIYEQPGGFEPNQPALPPARGIPLPAKNKKAPVSRYERGRGELR